jgi:hypothetical protein
MAKVKKATKPKICKFPGCTNKATSRWNCPTCRKAVEGMIARGETTEAILIEKGWVSPPKKKGRPAQSAAARAVAMLSK